MTFCGKRRDRRTEIKRAVRLARLALMLREGQELTSRVVAEEFDVALVTARRDLEDVGEIVPVVVEPGTQPGTVGGVRPGRSPDVYRMFRKEELA